MENKTSVIFVSRDINLIFMPFAGIQNLFEENFTSLGEVGASVSVWKDGVEILSLAGGWKDRHQTQPWTVETPILVWSATKGPAAACVLHACQQRGVSPDSPLPDIWPKFAQHGKAVSIAQAMSHQAGVPVLDRQVSAFDHTAVAGAIAGQTPFWEPGKAHGYHVRTYGYIADEIVRRLSGVSLGEYWGREFAEPLGLEFWIGVPDSLHDRIGSVFPAKTAPRKGDPFYAAFGFPGSLTSRAFGSPAGLGSVASMNTPVARQTSLPASGGVGTAHALGKFYAMLAQGGRLGDLVFFKPESLRWMAEPIVQGEDRILLSTTSFACGFMKDPVCDGKKTRALFGPSLQAFGHPGAGGSVGFADPENRVAFAYVMNQMEPGVFPNPKALKLIEALYRELKGTDAAAYSRDI